MDSETLGILGTMRSLFILALMAGGIYIAHWKQKLIPGAVLMGFALLSVFLWPATNSGYATIGTTIFAMALKIVMFFSLIATSYGIAYQRNDKPSGAICLVGAFIALML